MAAEPGKQEEQQLSQEREKLEGGDFNYQKDFDALQEKAQQLRANENALAERARALSVQVSETKEAEEISEEFGRNLLKMKSTLDKIQEASSKLRAGEGDVEPKAEKNIFEKDQEVFVTRNAGRKIEGGWKVKEINKGIVQVERIGENDKPIIKFIPEGELQQIQEEASQKTSEKPAQDEPVQIGEKPTPEQAQGQEEFRKDVRELLNLPENPSDENIENALSIPPLREGNEVKDFIAGAEELLKEEQKINPNITLVDIVKREIAEDDEYEKRTKSKDAQAETKLSTETKVEKSKTFAEDVEKAVQEPEAQTPAQQQAEADLKKSLEESYAHAVRKVAGTQPAPEASKQEPKEFDEWFPEGLPYLDEKDQETPPPPSAEVPRPPKPPKTETGAENPEGPKMPKHRNLWKELEKITDPAAKKAEFDRVIKAFTNGERVYGKSKDGKLQYYELLPTNINLDDPNAKEVWLTFAVFDEHGKQVRFEGGENDGELKGTRKQLKNITFREWRKIREEDERPKEGNTYVKDNGEASKITEGANLFAVDHLRRYEDEAGNVAYKETITPRTEKFRAWKAEHPVEPPPLPEKTERKVEPPPIPKDKLELGQQKEALKKEYIEALDAALALADTFAKEFGADKRAQKYFTKVAKEAEGLREKNKEKIGRLSPEKIQKAIEGLKEKAEVVKRSAEKYRNKEESTKESEPEIAKEPNPLFEPLRKVNSWIDKHRTISSFVGLGSAIASEYAALSAGALLPFAAFGAIGVVPTYMAGRALYSTIKNWSRKEEVLEAIGEAKEGELANEFAGILNEINDESVKKLVINLQKSNIRKGYDESVRLLNEKISDTTFRQRVKVFLWKDLHAQEQGIKISAPSEKKEQLNEEGTFEWSYEAMDGAGKDAEGTVTAESEEDAAKQIKDKGLFVTALKKGRKVAGARKSAPTPTPQPATPEAPPTPETPPTPEPPQPEVQPTPAPSPEPVPHPEAPVVAPMPTPEAPKPSEAKEDDGLEKMLGVEVFTEKNTGDEFAITGFENDKVKLWNITKDENITIDRKEFKREIEKNGGRWKIVESEPE